MKYDSSSALGAEVYDVDTKEKLGEVLYIDTDAMTVTRYEMPLRVIGESLVTYDMQFRSIYAIQGLEQRPCLFHCYGRLK